MYVYYDCEKAVNRFRVSQAYRNIGPLFIFSFKRNVGTVVNLETNTCIICSAFLKIFLTL